MEPSAPTWAMGSRRSWRGRPSSNQASRAASAAGSEVKKGPASSMGKGAAMQYPSSTTARPRASIQHHARSSSAGTVQSGRSALSASAIFDITQV